MPCTALESGRTCLAAQYNVYFGGQLVKSKGMAVVTDRLGSVRANWAGERMSYYPYGEEKTSTADGREKFGTYTRDNTATDYADQRYYAVGTGRFNSSDPFGLGVADPTDSTGWNQYAYVGGDPINFRDPTGTAKVCPAGSHVVYGGGGPLDNWCEPDDNQDRAGTPPRPAPVQPPTTLDKARNVIGTSLDWIKDRFSNGKYSPCGQDLSAVGTTSDQLAAAAGEITFLDGTTSNAQLSSLYQRDAAQAGANLTGTIADAFASSLGTSAMTQIGAPLEQTKIYFRPSSFGDETFFARLEP